VAEGGENRAKQFNFTVLFSEPELEPIGTKMRSAGLIIY
jgi:hypothetical protein